MPQNTNTLGHPTVASTVLKIARTAYFTFAGVFVALTLSPAIPSGINIFTPILFGYLFWRWFTWMERKAAVAQGTQNLDSELKDLLDKYKKD